jgi:hypothetical protein
MMPPTSSRAFFAQRSRQRARVLVALYFIAIGGCALIGLLLL